MQGRTRDLARLRDVDTMFEQRFPDRRRIRSERLGGDQGFGDDRDVGGDHQLVAGLGHLASTRSPAHHQARRDGLQHFFCCGQVVLSERAVEKHTNSIFSKLGPAGMSMAGPPGREVSSTDFPPRSRSHRDTSAGDSAVRTP